MISFIIYFDNRNNVQLTNPNDLRIITPLYILTANNAFSSMIF